MKIFAIGDLHLGFAVKKPMDIFGDNWKAHENVVKENWEAVVKEDDYVLIPGDISWATKFDDAKVDLDWIEDLPGKKILLKGNHDYWWQSIAKMQNVFKSITFLYNDFFPIGDIAICGTRGWICPNDSEFSDHDEKIYKREGLRLRLSLDKAKAAGFKRFYVMLHYPPTNDRIEDSIFTEIVEQYHVEKVIYGHIHSFGAREYQLKGNRKDTEYILTSADYINFKLVEIN